MIDITIYSFTFVWDNGEGKFFTPYISEIRKALQNHEVPEEEIFDLILKLEEFKSGEQIKFEFNNEIYIIVKKIIM